MAKTIEEIIEVDLLSNKNLKNARIIEIFCGFNQPKEKVVFEGLIDDIPDYLKCIRYTEATMNNGELIIVKYTDHKSFEGKKLFQQLQVPIQCNTQYL